MPTFWSVFWSAGLLLAVIGYAVYLIKSRALEPKWVLLQSLISRANDSHLS